MSKIGVVDDRTLPLVFMHSVIDEMDLDPYECRIYLRLARRAGMNGQAWESVPNMAKGCKMSERKCRDSLRELERRNLISKQTRNGSTTIYRLTHIPLEPTPAPDAAPHPTTSRRGTPLPHAAEVTPYEVDPNAEDSKESSARSPEQNQEAPGKSKEESPSSSPPEQNSSGAQQGTRRAASRKEKQPSPWQRFYGDALEIWAETKHGSWAELPKFSPRGVKYLKGFFDYFDKDLEAARERFRAAVAWARDHEDWWREAEKALGFDEIAANNKLENYAMKAQHAEKPTQPAQPDRTGEIALLDRHRELIWVVLIGPSPGRTNWHSGIAFDPHDPTRREVMYRLEIHPDFFVPRDRIHRLIQQGEIDWPKGAEVGALAVQAMEAWQTREPGDDDWEDE